MATTLSINENTKKRFDEQRERLLAKRIPRGDLGADEYLNHLMDVKEEHEGNTL